MVSKTRLFSCIASLAPLVVSEVSPPQRDITVDKLPDLSFNTSLDDIQALLSRHITDLSALLDNFTSTIRLPTRPGHSVLPLSDADSADPTICDCHPPIDSLCVNRCPTHGDIPAEQFDHSPGTISTDSSNGVTDPLPLAGLLPLRLLCTCDPPIAATCKILCANHGGTVWQPPKDIKFGPLSPDRESTQHRLQLQQDDPSDPEGRNSVRPRSCDCAHPTPSCRVICDEFQSGEAVDSPGDVPAGADIHHPIPIPDQGDDAQNPPSSSPNPSQPEGVICNCNNPTAGTCQILCANHGGQANGSDGINLQLQNASMPWPATDPLAEEVRSTASDESSTSRKLLTLTVQTSSGSSAPVTAEADLSSYASFATHSAITALGLASEIQPRSPSQSPTVSLHDQQLKVVGTVTLFLPEYNLHEAFYVVEPEAESTPGTETSVDAAGLPDFTVGVDFLLQIGGLAVGSHLST